MLKVTGGNILIDANLIFQKAQITEGMKIAGLGCGTTGHFVFPVAKLTGIKGRVYAVDIRKTALEYISKRIKQENLENIIPVWSDLEIFGATKIESNSIDLAFLINTLYLSQKRMEMLREAIRLLKKNGRLLIAEWKSTAIPFGPPLDVRVKQDLLELAAQKLGLLLVEEFEAGDYHFGLIFEKI
jgi:ubiquinone/menaquinone biosynthesis C-methylase UbiE